MRYKSIFVVLMLILCIGIVQAYTATLNVPASSATITGEQTWNVTLEDGGDTTRNCTVYIKSANTANSSYVSVNATVDNTSTAQTDFAGSFDTTSFEDNNAYSAYAICYNESGAAATSAARTAIVIDNTVPTAPSSLLPAAASVEDNSVTFSATVTDAETTACTLVFVGNNPGKTSYAMTYATTTCTYTHANIPKSNYDYYISATDGTNATASATTAFSVDENKVSMGAKLAVLDQQEEQAAAIVSAQESNKTKLLVGILLIGIVGYLLLSMNKK